MFIRNWKKEVFTIPNFLSMMRLLLIPVYAGVYLNASDSTHYFLAGGILAVSCLTDLIDGKIARRFHMISVLGKILDPLADKLTQFVITLCLCLKYPILYPVLGIFAIKELFQIGFGVAFLRRGKMLPGALTAGKVCTAVLFVSLILLVLMPGLSQSVVNGIAVMDTVFLSGSFVCYVLAYFGKNTKVQDIQTE